MGTCQTLDLVSTPTTSSSTCWKKFRRLGSQPQQNWWKSTVSLILGRPFKLIFRWRSSTTRSATGWTWQKENTTAISVGRLTHGRQHLTSTLRNSTRCLYLCQMNEMTMNGSGWGGWWRDVKEGDFGDPLRPTIQGGGRRFCKDHFQKRGQREVLQRSSLCNSSCHSFLQVRPIRVNYPNVVEKGWRTWLSRSVLQQGTRRQGPIPRNIAGAASSLFI